MKKAGHLLLLLFGTIGFLGCSNSTSGTNNGTDFTVPSDTVIVPFTSVDEVIDINFQELINAYSSPKRQFQIYAKTRRVYPISGSKIVSSISRSGNTFTVNVDNIDISEDGNASGSPAVARLEIDSLAEGKYVFNFLINGERIKGVATIEREYYTFELQSNNILANIGIMKQRIPETLIWGSYLSFNENITASFFDSLSALGTQDYNLETGNYVHFQIDKSGRLIIETVPEDHFMFEYKSDKTDIGKLVSRFDERYSEFFVRVLGGNGEIYSTQPAERPE